MSRLSALQLSQQFLRLRESDLGLVGGLESLAELFASDARVATPALGGEEVVGGEAVARAEREAQRRAYSVMVTRWEELDDSAVIASGHVRWPLGQHGFADANMAWLVEAADGKITRIRIFPTADEAFDAYLREAAIPLTGERTAPPATPPPASPAERVPVRK